MVAELAHEYQAALTAIDPQLDAPTARVLALVLADLDAPQHMVGSLTDDERVALEALHAAAPLLTLGVA